MRRLRVGDTFELHPSCGDDGRRYEVLRVTPCSATVRCVTREERVFRTWRGEEVAFTSPGRVSQISAHAAVRVVEGTCEACGGSGAGIPGRWYPRCEACGGSGHAQ